ncbi:MAG: glycosyltransferase [Planctomycetaceae bacterium]
MPLIIAGMPAAGTAVIADCLRLCGVRFVEPCGGPSGCGDAAAEPWGWVDAGGSLAVPVWLAAHPTARVVVCLRNPLEVAASLRDRHGVPIEAGLAAWSSHAHAILGATRPDRRIVIHYDTLRHDVVAAAMHLATRLSLPAPADLGGCRRAWRDGRSPRFTADDLVACNLDASLIAAYRALCCEAGHVDEPRAGFRADPGVLREAAGVGRDQGPTGAASQVERTVAALQADVARLRDALAARDEALHDLLDDLRHDVEQDHLTPEKRAYRQTVRGVRELVKDHVPPDGIVAIVSKGDDEVLRQRRCTAWHVPRDQRGGYLGYHPAGDIAAIANLETVRAAGATHLVVPDTHSWWLSSYPGFHRHLGRTTRLVESRPGAGTVYDLAPRPDQPAAAAERLAEALGRPPRVLAWNLDRAAEAFPEATIFAPPDGSSSLPHIDRSIDVVAVDRPSAAQLEEARRVARVAVVDLTGDPMVEWIDRPVVAEPPSVSIVIPVHGGWPVTQACLRALLPSLPAGWPVEVIVVDDASPDETPDQLAAIAEGDRRLVVLRNDHNLGFVGTCNRGAAAATGDYLVFLNNDTVPLPAWLPPLIRTFASFPAAAAVGGKLLFPDGRLQEAGGIIFDDASACHFGREHPDPAWPPFNHVRPVDYVSAALLATPRDLFLALGGFDPAYAPGYYEDTDYCFRLREIGREVLVQPATLVVHVEGATAGTDHAAGMKRFQEINRRRFQARHAAALMQQPSRPAVIDRDSWPALVHRGVAPGDR